MSSLTVRSISVPLHVDEHGEVRVANSRVLLDYVVEAWEDGESPETISSHIYDTLNLEDVYAVIAYYLQHKDDVRAYMRHRQLRTEDLRHQIEARHPGRAELRAKLLARKAQREQGLAASAQ